MPLMQQVTEMAEMCKVLALISLNHSDDLSSAMCEP